MKRSALLVMIAPIPAILCVVYLNLPEVWRVSQLVGLALLSAGLFLVTLARIQLGNAFSVTPRATMLITRGLYARIRNPIYVFGVLLVAGLILYLNRPWFLFLLIPVGAMQILRARGESKALEERFGEAYREYRSRTWF